MSSKHALFFLENWINEKIINKEIFDSLQKVLVWQVLFLSLNIHSLDFRVNIEFAPLQLYCAVSGAF